MFIVFLFGPKVGRAILYWGCVLYAGMMVLEESGYLTRLAVLSEGTKFYDLFGYTPFVLGSTAYLCSFVFIIGLVVIYSMTLINLQSDVLRRQNLQIQRLSEKLSHYIPKTLVRLLRRGESEVDKQHERKRLTIFLSDIKDFTLISDMLQPEETSKVLNLYLTKMCRIAEDYGGTVDKFIGDAILVYFGGIGDEDYRHNALQAVRMSIAMQDGMKEIHTHLEQEGFDISLQIRIGVNTGFVTLGSFGSEDRMDYTVIGREVNVASRLEGVCEPGGILVSHSTYALTNDHIEYKDHGAVKVKGIEKPLKVYEVIGEKVK